MFAIMKAERKLTVESLETDFTGETVVLLSLQIRHDQLLRQDRGVPTGGQTEAGYVEDLGQLLETLTGDLLGGCSSLEEVQEAGESAGVGVGDDEGGGEAGREGEEAGEARADQPQQVGGDAQWEALPCHHQCVTRGLTECRHQPRSKRIIFMSQNHFLGMFGFATSNGLGIQIKILSS